MNWSSYLHLAAAVPAAAVIIALAVHRFQALERPSRTRTADELLFIALLCALGLFVIYFNYYTGKAMFAYSDTGSDTIEQYVPFYCNLIGNFRDGTFSTWSFEYGLGVSLPSYQTWFFDPFNLFVVPMGLLLGDAHLSLVLVLSQSLKIVLSAYLFDHLLTRFCQTPIARVLGSALYGFGGFLVLFGQHYWLGSAVPVFTATALLFELYLERRTVPRFLGATAIVALQFSWSVYIAWMILLFEALYLLLRIPHYLEQASPRSYFLRIGRMAAPVACGALLGGVIFVPYASFLLGETTRTSSDSSALAQAASHLGFVSLDWVPATLSRALGSGLINTGVNTTGNVISAHVDVDYTGNFPYEYIQMGFSVGMFILIGQFVHWVFTECGARERALVGGGAILVLLYCFNQFLPTLFTALVRLQYRSSFVLAFPLCAAAAIGFEKRVLPGRIAWGPFWASVALTAAILTWSLVRTLCGRLDCLCYIAVLVVLTCVMALAGRRIPQGVAAVLAVALLFSTSVVDGFFATNSRANVSGVAFPLSGATDSDADTLTALEHLRETDGSFYRVEKVYSDWSPLNDSLIQHFDGVSVYNSTLDGDVDEFYHKLWKESISTWAVYSQGYKNDPDRPQMLRLLGVKYLLSKEPLAFNWCTLESQQGSVYVYEVDGADSALSLHPTAITESQADQMADSAARREAIADAVIVPDEADTSALGNGSKEAFIASAGTLNLVGQTKLTSTVQTSGNTVACLAVPHTGTWSVSIDGAEVETFRADYGFVGFIVPEGEHTVEASYSVAGLGAGCAMTAAGALGTIGCIVALKGRSRHSTQPSKQ